MYFKNKDLNITALKILLSFFIFFLEVYLPINNEEYYFYDFLYAKLSRSGVGSIYKSRANFLIRMLAGYT